jgi:tetratricopeptide (TPR) repeat protein
MRRFLVFLFFFFYVFSHAQKLSLNVKWIPSFVESNPTDSLVEATVKKHSKSLEQRMFFYGEISKRFQHLGNEERSLHYLLESYEWMKVYGNKSTLHKRELSIAWLYKGMKNYPSALDYAIKANQAFVASSVKDSLFFESNFLVGELYLLQGKNDFAKDYIQKVFEFGISKNKPYYLLKAYLLQGMLSKKNKDFSKSKNFLGNALQHAKKLKRNKDLGLIYIELASLHSELEDYQVAENFLEEALKNISLVKDERLKVDALLLMGAINLKQGKTEKAVPILEKVFSVGESFLTQKEQAKIAKQLMELYLVSGNSSKAHGFLKKYNALSDSIYVINRNSQLTAKATERKLKTQDKLILFYKEELTSKENRFWITLTFVVLLVFLFLFILRNFKNKRRLVEQEKELLESKRELARVELQQTKKELFENKGHLEQIANILIEKNKKIKDLIEELENIKNNEQIVLEDKKKIEQINELLDYKILTEDDWLEFRKIYNQVYEDVEAKLKLYHPDLTKSEKKLFMISKLKLSLDEVANLLAISSESVRKARYRLKKKLALEKNDLQDYIDNF